MPTTRRRFLTLLGLTPAIPLIGKIPVAEAVPVVELPTTISMRNDAVGISGYGGWCAPIEPCYDFHFLSEYDRPVRDSLPTVRHR